MTRRFLLGAAAIVVGLAGGRAATTSDLIPTGAENVVAAGHYTRFDVDMTPPQLETYYRQVLPRHGWEPLPGQHMGQMIYFSFKQPSGGGGSVSLLPNTQGTHVTLILPTSS
jgi:hypothetical protein